MRMLWRVVLVLLVSPVLLSAQYTCPNIHDVGRTGVIYVLICDDVLTEVTQGFYTSNTAKGGAPWLTFCPPGTLTAAAGEEPRWNTPTGFPAPCDVFSANALGVRVSAFVQILLPDGLEHVVDTSVHTLIYNGNDLVNFQPPLPYLVVEE
jgi:hypothetical protein